MARNKLLRVGLLVLVVVLFAWYFVANEDQFSRIWELSPWQVALIVLGQSIVILSNILMLRILVSFIDKHMPFMQAARVTAYSSLINFFGFLQGGLGFRGVYLKKYYQMSYKRYTALTLIQYLTFFGIAGLMLLVGLSFVLAIGQIVLLCIAGVLCLAGLAWLVYKLKPTVFTRLVSRFEFATHFIKARPIIGIVLATVLQLSGSLLANAVELTGIGADVTPGSLLIYTGISQFSIIVAVTPGAIGVREAILLLLQDQMHLTTSDIVVAATIDRLVYFITLGIFAPLALAARKNEVASVEAEKESTTS